MIDLSVIMASNRPKWLANCMAQYEAQKFDGTSECVVVGEAHDYDAFCNVFARWRPDKYINKEPQGYAGAFGKDEGIKNASGEYVCFWDDDNVYYPWALESLYSAANGFDIGIVQCGLMVNGYQLIPEVEEIVYGKIDTMCFCVRKELALTARWSDHRGVGTDYAWIKKLLRKKPSINFLNKKIGEHLNG